MDPLDTNQRVLIWICVLPAKKDATKRERIARITLGVTVYVIIISFIIGCGVFLYKHIKTDFESSLCAFYQLFGCSGVLYMTTAAFVMRHQIANVFVSLKTIYDDGKYCLSFYQSFTKHERCIRYSIDFKCRRGRYFFPFSGKSEQHQRMALANLFQMRNWRSHSNKFNRINGFGINRIHYQRAIRYKILVQASDDQVNL